MGRAIAFAAVSVLAIAGCATAIGLHDLTPPPLPPDDPAVCARTQGIAPATAPFCDVSGTCWQNPAPTGANLYHAWGACGDAWIVGKGGELIHWDGSAWTETPSTVTTDLFRIAGSSPTDVWFAGNLGTMLHWNGSAVSAVPLPAGVIDPMIAVWAATPSDAWALGAAPNGTTFLRWDGTSWSHVAEREMTGIVYNALWGTSANDVWVVGAMGAASHWDGKAWHDTRVPGDGDLTRVWGSGPNDVWATSTAGLMQHWDGTGWAVADASIDGSETPTDVWGGSATDVWIATDTALHHFDGTSWHVVSSGDDAAPPVAPNIAAGWSIGSGQTFMVGQAGLLVHGSGESLTRLDSGFRQDVNAIWANATSDVWLVGAAGMVKHWDGAKLQPFYSSAADKNAVWSDGANTWIAGNDGMVLFPGGRFPIGGALLTAVWGDDANVVWAGGVSPTGGLAIYRYIDRDDAGAGSNVWLPVTIDMAPGSEGVAGINAIHGTGPNDIWAVGNAGGIAHWDGQTWKLRAVGLGDPLLLTVLAVAPNDVWAAGYHSTDRTYGDVILHYDGASWTARNGPFVDECSCVPTCELACASQQRLWMMGGDNNPWLASSRGAIHKWDGAAWKRVAAGASDTRGFSATGDVQNPVLWAGGTGGTVRTIHP